MDIYIKLKNIGLEFIKYYDKGSSIKEFVLNKLTFKKRVRYNKFWGLKDINVTINKGDRVGVIGLNGAGKSTLLKTISRIYEPTTGIIDYKGVMASLIEIGAGFNAECTGRENIFLNGSILGFTKKELEKKYENIVRFAELENFIDTPVKYYSTGMYMRLAFTIATEVVPDILILDEIFAGGDVHFRKKASERLENLIDTSKIVIIVSHQMADIEKFCNRVLVIDHGRLMYDDVPEKAIEYYYREILKEEYNKNE